MIDRLVKGNVTDVHTMIAMGLIDEALSSWKFANNLSVGTDKEDMSNIADAYHFWDTPITLYVNSTNNLDTTLLLVQYLDANWMPKKQLVTLTGQTPVALSDTIIRIDEVFVASSTEPLGDIYVTSDTVRDAGGVPTDITTIKAKIDQGQNKSESCILSVPKGYYALMFQAIGGVYTPNTTVELIIYRRNFGGVFMYAGGFPFSTGMVALPLPNTLVPEKSDIMISSISPSIGVRSSAGFSYVLVRNELVTKQEIYQM